MSEKKTTCNRITEVYARCCGFFRPVQCFNKGAKAQYHARKEYKVTESMGSE